MRRHSSTPRVPQAHARPAPAASDTVSTGKNHAKPSASTAAQLGAMVGARLKVFAKKALDVTLQFAEWFVDLALEVAMDHVGQRLRAGKSARAACV